VNVADFDISVYKNRKIW